MNQSEADKFPGRVKALFRSQLGRDVLKALEWTYCQKVFDENSNRMAFKVGQSDLVQFLKDLTEEDDGS